MNPNLSRSSREDKGPQRRMAVNFLASGASRLLKADGDAYAIFLAPLAHDFRECLAAKSIPFLPQIVVAYCVFEPAKRMSATDRAKSATRE